MTEEINATDLTRQNTTKSPLKTTATVIGTLVGAAIGTIVIAKAVRSRKQKKLSKYPEEEEEYEEDEGYPEDEEEYEEEEGMGKKKSLGKKLIGVALGLSEPKPLPRAGWKRAKHRALFNTIELIEKRIEEFVMTSDLVPVELATTIQHWIKNRRIRKKKELKRGYVPRHFTMKELITFGTLVLPIVLHFLKRRKMLAASEEDVENQGEEEEFEQEIPQPRATRLTRPSIRRPFSRRINV